MTLSDLDLIELKSGEILSVVGTFRGEECRARLTFVPNPAGRYIIKGRPYQKISFESYGALPGCSNLLELPGEEHYLVQYDRIRRVYRVRRGFGHLTSRERKRCDDLRALLARACGIKRSEHGLGGGSVLGARRYDSDFDWVIYRRLWNEVRSLVTSDPSFTPQFTFSLDYIRRKYLRITILKWRDVFSLFEERWKFVRFKKLSISFNFVDPSFFADDFLKGGKVGRGRHITETVIDADGCYVVPRIITVSSRRHEVQVFTWLWLYNGAFQNGDVVEVKGASFECGGKEYLLVEQYDHYIRRLSRASSP